MRRITKYFVSADDASLSSYQKRGVVIWLGGGFLLLLFSVSLYRLSTAFAPSEPILQQPVFAAVSILIIAGGIYFAMLLQIDRLPSNRFWLIFTVLLGLAMRAILFFSTPVLEVDYNRYLWDGAVLANGENPYLISPAAVNNGQSQSPIFEQLKQAPGNTLQAINHPDIRTIYPLFTEAVFALAYLISPWQLWGWRLILLLADIATLALLVIILKQLNLPLLMVAIFWLNPLYAKEILNSAHMEALIFPFLLAALLFGMRRQYLWGVAFLAIAVGIKLWPAILLPLFLRGIGRDWRKQIAAGIIFLSIVGVAVYPLIAAGVDQQAGITAYAQRWQLNDAAFRIIQKFSEWELSQSGFHPGHAQQSARKLMAVLLAGWTLAVCYPRVKFSREFIDRSLLIIAALFMLSPTQFPWYAMWMLPLLAVSPRRPLLLLTVTLPLYYLWYYYEPRGEVEFFNNAIVWIEFLPVWIWILWDTLQNRKPKLVS